MIPQRMNPWLRSLFFIGVFAVIKTPWAFSDITSDNVQQILITDTQNSQKQEKDDTQFKKDAAKKSPSFQQKEWTGTQGSAETNVVYDYVGRASTNVGFGDNRNIDENYFDLRHQFKRHTLLA